MKKISSIIISSIIIILILMCTEVQASTSMQAKLEGETLEVKKGEEITVSCKLDNYQEISKGINAYKATFEYDKNVFEEVIQSNFELQNNWEELKFNKDTGEFVSIKKAGSKTGEVVAKITLKVKADATIGKTDIKMTEVVTSEGKEDINLEKEG